MFQGLFALKTSEDLLEKLRREYERLNQSPIDSDIAFNFFVTAEHLIDWVYHGQINKNKRTNLRDNDVLLQVCSHIANGSKHFVAESKHHKTVSDTSIMDGAFQSNAFQTDAFQVPCLLIQLEGEAQKKFGRSIEVLTLANQVLKYWESYINSSTQSKTSN